MTKATLTVAVCGTLLWTGTVYAGGLRTCQSGLTACTNDLSTCNTSLTSTQAQLSRCTRDLSACNTDAAVCATSLTACQGQLAAASTRPRFIDNGDGTVTDNKTGLMWEKKTTDGSVHDVTKAYVWSNCTDPGCASFLPTLTAFLDTLNDVAGGGAHCFAGYCDWRLPNEAAKELETLLDYTQGNCGGGTGACVLPAFDPAQTVGYWSATANPGNPAPLLWSVNFGDGVVSPAASSSGGLNGINLARAVRGGS